jgi:phytol kinase
MSLSQDPLIQNLLALGISFLYVVLVLGAAEGLRALFRLPADFTRKFVHIGVGMWSVGTALLFQSKWFAILPPLAFVAINYISYRKGLFMAMESSDRSNLGTVYFPIAFVAMIVLWFDVSRALFVASLMPLTWGDSLAAIVGRRWGRHRYTILGSTRSAEGSATMFVASALSLWLPLFVFFSGELNILLNGVAMQHYQGFVETIRPYAGLEATMFALVIALLATFAESRSPNGLDNLVVPVSVALVCVAIYFWYTLAITQGVWTP